MCLVACITHTYRHTHTHIQREGERLNSLFKLEALYLVEALSYDTLACNQFVCHLMDFSIVGQASRPTKQ